MTEIKCKNCASTLRDEEVNIETGLAKCRVCKAVFQITPAAVASQPPMQEWIDRYENEYKNVARPKRFKLNQDGSELTIVYPWSRLAGCFLTFFALAWNAIVSLFVVMGVATGELAVLLFMIPFILVGLGTAYGALVNIFNKTRLTLSRGALKIQHFPIPAPGNKTLQTSDIQQFFVEEVIVHHSSRHGGSSTHPTYHLKYLDTGNTRHKLLSMTTAEEALFLEKTIEDFLGIEDRAVSGELSR